MLALIQAERGEPEISIDRCRVLSQGFAESGFFSVLEPHMIVDDSEITVTPGKLSVFAQGK
jgi:hypothetical protein